MPDVKKTTGERAGRVRWRRSHGRQRSSSLQTNTSRQKKRDRMYYVRLLLAVVIGIVSLALFSCFSFFKLEHVFLTGDPIQDLYAREEVAAAAGLWQGASLLFLDGGAIEETLPGELPYVAAVEVKRRLPDILELTLTRAQPAYCIEGPDGWYLLDAEMKVLEKTARGTGGYPVLRGFAVAACEPGKPVDLSGDEFAVLRVDIVRQIMESETLDVALVTELDLSDVYFIRLTYDERFTVWLGDLDDLDAKFTLLRQVVAEQDDAVTGRIDLTEDGRATLRPE